MSRIAVIGAGLAGCEAAWQIAQNGMPVTLVDMKPDTMTPAHHSPLLAELVCSNSLKAARLDSAAGLLKEEMRRLGSVSLAAAETARVAAGGALAVDRELFSAAVTERITAHPNITLISERVDAVPQDGVTVIATGPLTEDKLAGNIAALCKDGNLSFYDAAAPIVTAQSIDYDHAFFASRYGGEDDTGDYINCPLDKLQYEAFYDALVTAETALLHDMDRVYEGCMPIEVLAKRGGDSIRFGPMKPVGLRDPRTGHRPWAVLQLRRENAAGTIYNLVGFQTNLKFGEQKRVFSMIPALRHAEFIRYGVMHRNTFINSPRLLAADLSLREHPNVFFAGQLSGVEGYMESAASGIIAGINALRRVRGMQQFVLPEFSMIGALLRYITDETVTDFQPMGANFGILPPLSEPIRDKRARYGALSARSLDWFDANVSADGIHADAGIILK